MKYIRTENGIYDAETTVVVNVNGVKCVEFWIDGFTSTYKKIIKEADTIEELCDELVVVCSNHNEVYSTKNETLESIKFWYSEKAIVYGAIWTSKGLIYVAKMDSEGKLVLI